MTIPDVLVVSKRWFDSLPAEDQTAIRKASRLAAIQQRKLWVAWVEQMKNHVQRAGIQIRAIEQPLFKETAQSIYQTFPELDATLVETIQAIQHVK